MTNAKSADEKWIGREVMMFKHKTYNGFVPFTVGEVTEDYSDWVKVKLKFCGIPYYRFAAKNKHLGADCLTAKLLLKK